MSRIDPLQTELLPVPDGPSPWPDASLLRLLHPGLGVIGFTGDVGVLVLGGYLAAWFLSRGQRVIVVDGSDSCDLYRIKDIARRLGRRPGTFFKRLSVARGRNCHDIDRLITQKVLDAARTHQASTVILSGVLEAFYDERVPESEARRLVAWMAKAVRAMAADIPLVVLLCPEPPPARRDFASLFTAAADRLYRVATEAGSSPVRLQISPTGAHGFE